MTSEHRHPAFIEGMTARDNGCALDDNPYCDENGKPKPWSVDAAKQWWSGWLYRNETKSSCFLPLFFDLDL